MPVSYIAPVTNTIPRETTRVPFRVCASLRGYINEQSVSIVENFLESPSSDGVDWNAMLPDPEYGYRTPLEVIVELGICDIDNIDNVETLLMLLKSNGMSMNKRNSEGNSALHLVAKRIAAIYTLLDTVNPLEMSQDDQDELSELEDLYALLVDVGVKRRLRNNDGLRAKDIIRSTVENIRENMHLREMEHDETTEEDDSDVLSNDTQSLSGDPDMNDEDEDFDDDATVVEDDDSYSIVDLSESTDRLSVHSVEETPGVIEGWGREAIIV